MRKLALAAGLTACLGILPAHAAPFVETELAPIVHTEASLTIVAPDGSELVFTPAELEALPTYSLTTTTPWRPEPARFEGVLLSDVLDAGGLGEAASIRVTAENDYTTVIERALLDELDILVATRVDGQAHSRRHRGPIQFVLDADAFAASEIASESNFVWMAARIEAGT